jgi:hypothetical protein
MILKNKRNLWLFIFVFFLLVSFQPKAEAASTVDISAKAAILMDEESGRVLFAENAEQRLPQASLTKIMTPIKMRAFFLSLNSFLVTELIQLECINKCIRMIADATYPIHI